MNTDNFKLTLDEKKKIRAKYPHNEDVDGIVDEAEDAILSKVSAHLEEREKEMDKMENSISVQANEIEILRNGLRNIQSRYHADGSIYKEIDGYLSGGLLPAPPKEGSVGEKA